MRIHWMLWCSCNHNDFTTPIISKCCYICYRLAVIYRGVLNSPILGVTVVLAGWDLHQSKTHPRLPSPCQYKVLLYLPPFGLKSNVNFWPSNLTPNPIWLIRVVLGGRKWYQTKSRPNVLIRRPYTIGLTCTVLPQYTMPQTDRQTERWQ